MKKLFPLLFVFGAACSPAKHDKPNYIYMEEMVYSPAFKAQEEGAMRMPVKGTVPRDFVVYPFPKDPERAARELINLFPKTLASLKRGQYLYQSYCLVCHGPAGEGDGTIVPKFPRPPSLQSDKVMKWPDGRIYHVIAAGQNLMPSYASQISSADRWAIVNYLRALHRSKHPTPEDLRVAATK